LTPVKDTQGLIIDGPNSMKAHVGVRAWIGGAAMTLTRTWILVADGARARILCNDGPGKGLHAVEGCVFQGEHARTHEMMSDREGRMASSVGSARSAVQARSDPHRELKRKFAHKLADELALRLAQQAYGRLIIIAAPSVLGDLRHALSENVRDVLTGELAKDLTKTPDDEIASHVMHILRA
jgi:protein required for attachment to host cells